MRGLLGFGGRALPTRIPANVNENLHPSSPNAEERPRIRIGLSPGTKDADIFILDGLPNISSRSLPTPRLTGDGFQALAMQVVDLSGSHP